MFYGNEVIKFLNLQKRIEKLQTKPTTMKNQHRLFRLRNEKEKVKAKLYEIGTLAEEKSIFPVQDLATLLTASLTIVEGKDYRITQEDGNVYIVDEEHTPVLTLPSDKICDGKYQLYTFQKQKLQEDCVRVLQSNLDLSRYDYLYFLLNELIGKKIKLQKENLNLEETVYFASRFFMLNSRYTKRKEEMIQSFYQKKK